ncbi:MAG: DUF1816 domain-containing protein [Elainella sp.]
MNDFWLDTLEFLGLAWWVEITTESPSCVYYFGPYGSSSQAKAAQPGFVADLEQEGARGIKVNIKRCKPAQLTIFDEGNKSSQSDISPIMLGGQV